eukprot:GHVO01006924.1.p1 GENE.GHVO01006924.1~~GHVO01006924.1.p1  ORF type:complete len:225 (+),score=35.31 GHVO01006924.1:26-676(+)
MPNYKLFAFNVFDLAEGARWMFALAGQPYEDNRFDPSEWPEIKKHVLLGTVPILTVDGKELAEYRAIYRHLGKQFGFFAEAEWDQARCDMIADYIDEMRRPMLKIHAEGNKDQKKRMMEKFPEEFEQHMATLEKLLMENKGGDGYFTGDKMTWTDVMFVITTRMLRLRYEKQCTILEMEPCPPPLVNHPKLKDFAHRVKTKPEIWKWIQEHPQTPW